MMDHPNIVAYHDNFERDGLLFIEMEYVDGGTLAQFLANQAKRLDERNILVIFHQIVSAVRHMHEHNVLHRDLKTANIFLTKQGVVKVSTKYIGGKLPHIAGKVLVIKFSRNTEPHLQQRLRGNA